MFIYCKMAPGLYPADACQECPPELPRLSSTEDKQTFASDHTDFMETTASSSNREVGAVGQEQRTCNETPRYQASRCILSRVPSRTPNPQQTTVSSSNREDRAVGREQRTCNGNLRHQACHHHRGRAEGQDQRTCSRCILPRENLQQMHPERGQDQRTCRGNPHHQDHQACHHHRGLDDHLHPVPHIAQADGDFWGKGINSTYLATWGYLATYAAIPRKGLVEFTSQVRIMLFVSLSLH